MRRIDLTMRLGSRNKKIMKKIYFGFGVFVITFYDPERNSCAHV